MARINASAPCVVILTALPVEYRAVRAHLTNLREELHPQGTIYERGIFTSGTVTWEVGIVEIGAGNAGAAQETERAINHFKPSVALFVGVAGGIKDAGLGDVVASTKIYGYGSGKARNTFETRPDVGVSSYRLVQRAQAEARSGDWTGRILGRAPQPPPRALVAPIAAGEVVVASQFAELFVFLREHYGDAVVVEMEGRGFLKATHANSTVNAIVVRGVSDLIEKKREADADGWQEVASRNASAFAYELLAKLPGGRAAPDELAPILTEPGEGNPSADDLTLPIATRQQYEAGTALPRSLLTSGPGQSSGFSANFASLRQDQVLVSLAPLSALAAYTHGFNSPLFGETNVTLDPPPLPARLTRRSGVVMKVLTALRLGEPTVLFGEAMTGKSVLARLAADAHGHPTSWIRLTGMDVERAGREIDAALSAITGSAPLLDRGAWYSEACRRLGSGSLVVIDDLPSFEVGDSLAHRLSGILSCRRHGVGLLFTTSAQIPTSFASLLPSVLTSLQVPPLDQGEVAELLGAWGASAEFIARTSKFIHLICRSHPLLIAAACAYLLRRDWKLGDEEFDALLGANHTDSAVVDVDRRLRRTVTDPSTRELLYRLALVGDSFPAEFADSVAAVAPPIDRPRERLADLAGHWVKELAGGMFEVSPLLSKLAEQRLSVKRRAGCHRRIGNALIRRPYNQDQAAIAISHLHRAADFDRAGGLLLMVLTAALHEARDLPDCLIFDLWSSVALPVGMSLNVRLTIRAVQISIAKRRGRPTDFLISDLSGLASEAGPAHRFGLTAAATYLATRVDPQTMATVLGIVGRLQRLPAERPARLAGSACNASEQLALPKGLTVGRLLPVIILGIDSSQALLAWLEAVLLLPDSERERLFVPEGTSLFFPAAADFLITTERKKSESERDWPAVLSVIESFGDKAMNGSCPELWASAIRARILVLADQTGKIDEAVALARSAVGSCVDRPFPRLLIAGVIGEILLKAGRIDEARGFLLDAVRSRNLPFYHETMMSLLYASRVVGDQDSAASIGYAERAVAVACNLRKALPLAEIKALAELAWAKRLEGGPQSAFPDWDRAATRLLDTKGETDAWKDLFVMFGHATGFLARIAAGGEPPSKTGDGDEYAPPMRGMFMTENKERLDYFRRDNVTALPYLMWQYAASIGDSEAVDRWRKRVKASGAARDLPLLRAGIYREEIAQLLLDGEVARAISQASESARIMVALASDRMRGRPTRYGNSELDAIAAQLGGDDASKAESLAAMMGVVPATIRVATLFAGADQSPTLDAYARLVVDSCKAQSPDGPGRVYWESVADPIEQAFIERLRHPDLLRWKEAQGRLQPEREAIAFIALAANATVEQAIGVHLPIMPLLEKWYEPGSPVHHLILLPYVERYWTAAFSKMRFRFARPTIVEDSLPEALRAQEPVRIRAILRVIVSGLGSRPPQAFASWLSSPFVRRS